PYGTFAGSARYLAKLPLAQPATRRILRRRLRTVAAASALRRESTDWRAATPSPAPPGPPGRCRAAPRPRTSARRRLRRPEAPPARRRSRRPRRRNRPATARPTTARPDRHPPTPGPGRPPPAVRP